jgi:polyisoprenoid-binding protein YceI
MITKNFSVDSSTSTIEWVGRKVTGAHNGTIRIANGNLEFTDGELTGGKITIDTRSIVIVDVTDPDTNAQFAGHLASDDFFSSEKYPTATVEITSVSKPERDKYHVAAVLTIKGISHTIEFNAEVEVLDNDIIWAVANIVIDRTLYEMRFRSGNFFKDLGDTLIYNDFSLRVRLSAKAVAGVTQKQAV